MAADTAATISTVACLLRVDPRDGNDPIEVEVRLPIVPRKGDTLSIWVDGSVGSYSHAREEYPTVEDVVLCSWAPERIEVWLRFDCYDLDEVRRIMLAAERNEQP